MATIVGFPAPIGPAQQPLFPWKLYKQNKSKDNIQVQGPYLARHELFNPDDNDDDEDDVNNDKLFSKLTSILKVL